jgi:hypothetical protein
MPTECPFPFAFTFSELTFMNAIHELGQLLISEPKCVQAMSSLFWTLDTFIYYSYSYENVTLLLNLANFCEVFAKVCESLRKFAKICESLRKFVNFCENLRIKKLSNLPIFQLLRPNFDKKFGFLVQRASKRPKMTRIYFSP